MNNYFSKIFTPRAIAMKPYPHRNGNHIGIILKSEALLNVSTPVLTNNYSETLIITKPKIKIKKSFLPLFI